MSPELEQTLSLLSSHRAVLGYILLGRGHPVSIIRHSGVVFEGEQGKKYAGAIGRIVESVQAGLEEVHVGDGDAVRLTSSMHATRISNSALG
jgi:dynein light chain roadblock-type